MNDKKKPTTVNEQLPAAISEISLSQAILAPLDALFKAQVHAARSFLNLLLQIGYPDIKLDKSGAPVLNDETEKEVYVQDFYFKDQDGDELKLSIPALSLVPITPLTIDNANFKLNFKVEKTSNHAQMQEQNASSNPETSKNSENKSQKEEEQTDWDTTKRPWYLVKEPVSFRGNVAPSKGVQTEFSDSSSSYINIEINLVRQALPAGLDKLLTALQQSSTVKTTK